MSTVVCSKQFTLQVAIPVPAPTAYWTCDETTGTRTDSVSGLTLTEAFGGPIGSAAGIINLGIAMPGLAAQELRNPANTATLAYQGLGITVACWFKVNAMGTNEIDILELDFQTPNAATYCQYFPGTNSFEVWWDQTGGLGDSKASQTGFPVAVGGWHFLAWWFDPSDKKVRYQIDNGTVVVGNAIATAIITTGTTGRFFVLNLHDTDIQFDEIGVWLGGILTANQLTALYNNGNGLRPV